MANKIITKKNFTLIELLVSISIIGILTGIVVINFSSFRYKAFDTTRIADIRNVELALEVYRSVNGVYPDNGVQGTSNYILGLDSYISNNKLPTDPQGKHTATEGYLYNVSDNKKEYCFTIKNTVYNAASQPDLQLNPSINKTWAIKKGSTITCPI